MLSETKHLTPVASAEILRPAQNDKAEVARGLGGHCASFLPTLVLSEHFLPQCGGSITWLLQTYGRYSSGEAVVVAGEHGDTMLVDQNLPFKVERIRMWMNDWDPTRPASLSRYFDMFLRVRKSLRRHQLSQIHCIKVLPEGFVAWWMRRFFRVPYMLYAHGEEIQMRLTSRILGWLIPPLYKGADAIIANSRHTKELLELIGVRPERIHVIHPGVNAAEFRATEDARRAVRQRHGLGEAVTLLTVGRLQRRKGQDMVIKALPLIKERFPKVKYLIVGTGEEHASLQQLAQDHGVREDVVFAGSVSDGDRAAYYAACDLFLMPNRQIDADIEGFGIVFLEAAAAGKPVIGGRSGGTGEAIQDGVTGIRVDGENVEAIAAAVIEILADSDKARAMGEQGRRWVEKAFSWESIVERTRQVAAMIVQGDR
jgi:phosphatidyl-myo-inositol dimannoside synthase